MRSLKNILALYAEPSVLGGSGELSPKQVLELKKHLEKRKRINQYLLLGSGLIAVVGLVYIISFTGSAEQLASTIGKSSVVGVSIAGLFAFILNMWKENSYINLLLIFVTSMDETT